MIFIHNGYTDVGGRGNNEDAYTVCINGQNGLFVVADGLGGHECGEVASKLAVDTVGKLFSAPEPFDPAFAVREANGAILEEQQKTGKRMHTTVVLVYVHGDAATVVHTGDSRAYVFRDGRQLFRTLDHSASQLAVAAGEITPDQIRFHPERNVLTKVLGGSENLRPDVTALACKPGDAILLCSDGFWEYVTEEDIIRTLKYASNPSKWLKKMRSIRNEKAPEGSDNHTAVAVYLKKN